MRRAVLAAVPTLLLMLCCSTAEESVRAKYCTWKYWWLDDYKELEDRLDAEYFGDLMFAYSVRGGTAEVKVRLHRITDDGLGLMTTLPAQTFGAAPSDAAAEVTIEYRDRDVDGCPDDFRLRGLDMRMSPLAKRSYVRFTDDGYVVLGEQADFDVAYFYWTVGIAVTTNRVLHGKVTILPSTNSSK